MKNELQKSLRQMLHEMNIDATDKPQLLICGKRTATDWEFNIHQFAACQSKKHSENISTFDTEMTKEERHHETQLGDVTRIDGKATRRSATRWGTPIPTPIQPTVKKHENGKIPAISPIPLRLQSLESDCRSVPGTNIGQDILSNDHTDDSELEEGEIQEISYSHYSDMEIGWTTTDIDDDPVNQSLKTITGLDIIDIETVSDIELVVKASKRLEFLLQRHFKATGTGLGSFITSANQYHRFPPYLLRAMRHVADTRNKLVHDQEYQSLERNSRDGFIMSFEISHHGLSCRLDEHITANHY